MAGDHHQRHCQRQKHKHSKADHQIAAMESVDSGIERARLMFHGDLPKAVFCGVRERLQSDQAIHRWTATIVRRWTASAGPHVGHECHGWRAIGAITASDRWTEERWTEERDLKIGNVVRIGPAPRGIKDRVLGSQDGYAKTAAGATRREIFLRQLRKDLFFEYAGIQLHDDPAVDRGKLIVRCALE